MKVTVVAPAKINLTLDVLGRRPDGYHEIRTVMQAVDLCDTVTLTETASRRITLEVAGATLPPDEKNTAYKAAREFLEAVGRADYGVHILLQKHIPMQAGMAGGSADAAAVLRGMNILFGNPLLDDTLCTLAARVGADVPFCLMGGTALATGIGTTLSPLSSKLNVTVVVAKPEVGVSTAAAYAAIDSATGLTPSDTEEMCRALTNGDGKTVGALLHNHFEEALALPAVLEILAVMRRFSPLGCRMTGSGSATFALFATDEAAENCAAELKKHCRQVYICHPCSYGAVLAE